MSARAERSAIVTLPDDLQARLDVLMDGHNEGRLTSDELAELEALVAQTESLALANARRLMQQHTPHGSASPDPAST